MKYSFLLILMLSVGLLCGMQVEVQPEMDWPKPIKYEYSDDVYRILHDLMPKDLETEFSQESCKQLEQLLSEWRSEMSHRYSYHLLNRLKLQIAHSNVPKMSIRLLVTWEKVIHAVHTENLLPDNHEYQLDQVHAVVECRLHKDYVERVQHLLDWLRNELAENDEIGWPCTVNYRMAVERSRCSFADMTSFRCLVRINNQIQTLDREALNEECLLLQIEGLQKLLQAESQEYSDAIDPDLFVNPKADAVLSNAEKVLETH